MNPAANGRVTIVGTYELLGQLGSGSFAVVYLGRHVITGCRVAIKVILRSSIDSDDAATRFTREISILSQLNHPFITELFEVLEQDDAYYLVMEYAEHGSMLDYVNSRGPLPEGRARRFFCQMISALDYLHNTKFFAHRDLKAENVLLDRNDNIRLIDFGLSRAFTKGTPTLATACGSPAYAAPEMIRGQPYTKAADIWSAGVLLYALVAGHLPFDDTNPQAILQKVITEPVEYPSEMSLALIELLSRMLTKDPNSRITIDRLKEQPWFTQSEFAQLVGFDMTIFHGDTPLGVDREVLERMLSYGIDCETLEDQLSSKVYSSLTAVYRQLRRHKLTNQIVTILEGMHRFRSPSLHRPMRAPSPTPELAQVRRLVLPMRGTEATRRTARSTTPTPCTSVQNVTRPMAQRPSAPSEPFATPEME